MPKESLQDMQDRIVREAQDKARASHDNIRQATLPLSQVDSIMVKRMVSDADVLANAGKYHATSVGSPKWIAGFDTIEKARTADTTKAKTLTEFEYPDEHTILIIEKS